ncbi:MAG: pyridoxamine 5'-phosphate oxidase family protein [Opitutales bacterium]|nr:pyridoxamine 5'-phosphate oxidase family protein [Opitutales bacterium]
MSNAPSIISESWKTREGPAIFATVSKDGVPNIVYVGALDLLDEGSLVIANNYFEKTKANLATTQTAALLFMDANKKAYQFKGTLSEHSEGPAFDRMKAINPSRHPGHTAVVLHVTEVYSGSNKLY